MSNESSLNEGKSSTNEKDHLVAGSSQSKQVAFPPPPPHDPSSSSSIPPSHPEVSVAFQLAQLFSLVTQNTSENQVFKAVIARLSSQNEAQAASITLLNSRDEARVGSLARLSSENAELRKTVEDQGFALAQLSRVAASDGYWLWEGGRDQLERLGGEGEVDGRWLWSLEKYKPRTPRPRTGPPPSLDSLPVELIDIIISLLDQPEHVALCTVSFRLLQQASSQIYGSAIVLRSKQALLFFTSRSTDTPSSYNRIRSLLLPKHIYLSSTKFKAAHLDPLYRIRNHHDLIPIHTLAILSAPSSHVFPVEWHSIFNLINPQTLQFGTRRSSRPDFRPTTFK